jgi:hypothetical protein
MGLELMQEQPSAHPNGFDPIRIGAYGAISRSRQITSKFAALQTKAVLVPVKSAHDSSAVNLELLCNFSQRDKDFFSGSNRRRKGVLNNERLAVPVMFYEVRPEVGGRTEAVL